MTWEATWLEKRAKELLASALSEESAEVLMGAYAVAREVVLYQVSEEIKAVEPSLTDHGPRHIKNVMENIYLLIGDDHGFKAQELYILMICTLYHDVGNFFRRENHNRNIKQIFSKTFPDIQQVKQIKKLLYDVAGAHTGKSKSGDDDPIKDIGDNYFFLGESVKARELAAILRFADELAEGGHRTSALRADLGTYEAGSRIYHIYAQSCKEIIIDRLSKRIAIDIDIDVSIDDDNFFCNEIPLQEFIAFVYKKILKLDQERKYNKFYSQLLSPFQNTSVIINFWHDDDRLGIPLSPLVLSDIVIPGEQSRSIPEFDKGYEMDTLIASIKEAICNA